MKITMVLEKSTDGSVWAYMVKDLPKAGIIGNGKTIEECKRDVLEIYKEYRADNLVPVLEFEWRYDIASFMEYFNFLDATEIAKLAGITWSRYKKGTKANQDTFLKFYSAFNKVKNELSNAVL